MRVWLLALLLFSSSRARADDGSWSATYDLAQGPLYTLEGNPDVELSRELLILEDVASGSVEARFEFRNTSPRELVVEAGFPVVLDVPFTLAYEHKGGVIRAEATGRPVWLVPSGKHGGDVDPRLLALAGLKVRRWTPGDEDQDLGDRYVRGSDFRRRERPVPRKPPFRFAIEQDGRAVGLTSLVVESDPSARPAIVFHFRHQLRFAPGQTSLVRVRYAVPTLAGGSNLGLMELEHTWRYVLRTGASWKGPIGQLVLAIPAGGQCDEAQAWTPLGRWAGYQILSRRGFEPGDADDLRCTWKWNDEDEDGWDRFWFDPEGGAEKTTWNAARRLAPDVKDVRGSSAVGEKVSVYSECCVVEGAPNTAEAAFDGLAETAWSEAGKRDAGEFLELELTRPAGGVRILAGFLAARHAVSGDKAGQKQRRLLAGLYRWNSRPKRLELASLDGKTRFTLDLADARGEWNVFPVWIPAGKYRLTILSTYRGTKWQDTSIGEIDFMTGELAWLEALRQDSFFASFFADGKPFRQAWIDRTTR